MKSTATTLALHSQFWKEIIEKEISVINYNFVLLYKCRSNALKLDWRNRFVGGDARCRVCGTAKVETMEHFLLECGGLREVQEMSSMGEVPICELLLFGVRREENMDKYRRYIGRLWSKRKEIHKGIAQYKTAKSHVFLLMQISYPYIVCDNVQKFHETHASSF